tara:strand:- start:118 stop:366 length:249 start_codon:yes stop_codon:yes gene_type:complete
MNRVFAVVGILFCFEIGFFLIFIPWSTLWEDNLLFLYAPALRPFFISYMVRVGVSGLGILDFLIGLSEVHRCFCGSTVARAK